MNQPLYNIRELIKELPEKDAILAAKFLEDRNFQGIMELVESDIYKERVRILPDCLSIQQESENRIAKWLELKSNLDEYMSYLEVPDNSDDIDEEVYYD